MKYLRPIRFRQVGFLNAANRFANVHRAIFRIERRVGGELDVFGAVEIERTLNRGFRAEGGGIGVKLLEAAPMLSFSIIAFSEPWTK